MKRFLFALAFLAAFSCTSKPQDPETPEDDQYDISAEKKAWVPASRASDDRVHAKDLPWEVGEKVMLVCTSEEIPEDGTHWAVRPDQILCTVSKVAGLKCKLTPDSPLKDGTYRAVYPVYNYVYYAFYNTSIYIHLSFLYEESLGLDFLHQDIVVSDPVTYKEGQKLAVVMKHICALVDIDIYPPKTGKYSYLKLFAQHPVFAGKADIYLDEAYDIDKFAQGWLNFTTLRGEGTSLTAGELFPTTTGLLPIQYDGMPMCIHIVYEDGTHYVSEPIAMPSLNFGVENHLEVRNFTETTEPMNGQWGDFFNDENPTPYPIH